MTKHRKKMMQSSILIIRQFSVNKIYHYACLIFYLFQHFYFPFSVLKVLTDVVV